MINEQNKAKDLAQNSGSNSRLFWENDYKTEAKIDQISRNILMDLRKFNIKLVTVVLVISYLLTGCYATRNVADGEFLLLSNSHKIDSGSIKKHSISSYYAQKPNKKILFYRFYLNMYNLGTLFPDSSWFNRQLTQNIGEPPVIYDSTLVDLSGKNIKRHLDNLGYYNNSVSVEIKTWESLKVAKVKYIIHAQNPYIVRNINYQIPENDLKRFVQADLSNSLIKSGIIFNIETFENERDRITDALNNAGYYYFIRDQITFEADTNLNTHQVDLNMKIMPLKARGFSGDSVKYLNDRRYTIQDIYIIYNLLKTELNNENIDTTKVSVTEKNDRIYNYYFIHYGPLNINPKAIINAIFIKPGVFYKKRDILETYKALTSMDNFRFINIELNDISKQETVRGELICNISLLSNRKYSFNSNSEVKHTGGDFGLEQNIGLRSRNTFKSAEIMAINLHGAMEMQSSTNVNSTSKWPFNVYEAGINGLINFPRFISPFQFIKGNRYLRPNTNITVGYNYQKRSDYTRYIINGSFGYTWQPRPKYYNNLRLLEISSVKIYPTSEFQQIIDKYRDPRIRYSFQDHMVLATNYSFTYNEHRYKGSKPFSFFFGAIEIGGMPWNLIPRINNVNEDSVGQILLFGVPSAEYVKLEIDARHYIPSGRNNMNVFRSFIGIGLPYGGSKALPFEKSFYIGGANSLRGWAIGTLGPGSFNSNATTFEMTGDIKIEFNYEFRFLLLGNLEAALFTDVGNIWLLNKSDAQPGGNFKFSTFIPQFAIDFGYGLRYDLEFLIIRFDIAHPIYQPYYGVGSRWTAMSSSGNLLAGFNFAIGYPF
jgi:outer membrane protein assembly factor BamA